MTKIELIPDILVSYYYHAARDAADLALQQKVPDSLQNAIIAVVMSQCALEAYINHYISQNQLSKHKVDICQNGKCLRKELSAASIRDKWEQVPIVVNGHKWDTTNPPFTRFSELVGQRNDLIHFDAKKYIHIYNSPTDISHTDDLSPLIQDGKWLAGSKILKLAAIGVSGPKIIHDMISGLHDMLGTKPPDFLNSEKVIFRIKILETT